MSANTAASSLSMLEIAVMEGRAFLASTDDISISGGDTLSMTLNNPAGSGKSIYLWERWFNTDRTGADAPLQYIAYANPTVDLATPVNTVNLRSSRQTSKPSVGVVKRQNGAPVTMGGITGSRSRIATNGELVIVKLLFIIDPGNGVGFEVVGDGGGLTDPADAGVTLMWSEERS